jgi:hypothetical protein
MMPPLRQKSAPESKIKDQQRIGEKEKRWKVFEKQLVRHRSLFLLFCNKKI